MISRIYRFHGHGSLSYLFRHGKTERVEYLSLRFTPNKKEDYRLAIVVSKKVSKSAVVRNRIRRRLYEAVRVIKKSAGGTWKFDMSLTVYDEKLAKLPANEVHEAVVRLLKKAKII